MEKGSGSGGVDVAGAGGRVAVSVRAGRVAVGKSAVKDAVQARIAINEKTEMSDVRVFLGLMGSSMATLTLRIPSRFPEFKTCSGCIVRAADLRQTGE